MDNINRTKVASVKSTLYYWTGEPDIELEMEKNGEHNTNTFLIPIYKRVGDRIQDDFQNINEFSTSIVFNCPVDSYITITGSNQLLKAGYKLPHPVVITHGNKEEVIIYLEKFADKDDLLVPFHNVLKAVVNTSSYAHLRKIKGNSHHSLQPHSARIPESVTSSFY